MRKSVILFITIIILIIISILGLFIGGLVFKQLKFTREILNSGAAIVGADAGLEKALSLMSQGALVRTCGSPVDNWFGLGNGVKFCIDYEGAADSPDKLVGKGYFHGVYRALEIYFE